MNIFKKLFARHKPSEEEMLVMTLQQLSNALRPHDSHWAGVVASLRDKLSSELANGAPVTRRYQLVREIESLFGGMGSLNDIQMPATSDRLRGDLFSAVQGVLRVYWRALGRPSQTAQVRQLPVGAAVRVIPGAVRYFERDESPVLVADTPTVRSQTWRVVRCDGPDITNMPSYLVEHDNTFMSARHESLELVRE